MIIGIDEVGDFATYSQRYNFFVAILIDQSDNSHQEKKADFEKWEESISPEKIENGEIKGRLLTEDDLRRFAIEVIRKDKQVRIESVCFIPSDSSTDAMEQYKEIQIDSIEGVIKRFIEKGNGDVVEKFSRIRRWFDSNKQMNYQHYMKLLLLNQCIAITHNSAIRASILLEKLHDKEARNLLEMEFKIDQNFLDTSQKVGFWKEFLRIYLLNESKDNPTPLLEEWKKTGHPFLDKYRKDGYLNFKDLFENHCNFLDSKEHFEIRIADIVGTIFHRKFNKGECTDVYDSLFNWCSSGQVKMPHGIRLDENIKAEEYQIT